jgi:hypothetical protein
MSCIDFAQLCAAHSSFECESAGNKTPHMHMLHLFGETVKIVDNTRDVKTPSLGRRIVFVHYAMIIENERRRRTAEGRSKPAAPSCHLRRSGGGGGVCRHEGEETVGGDTDALQTDSKGVAVSETMANESSAIWGKHATDTHPRFLRRARARVGRQCASGR